MNPTREKNAYLVLKFDFSAVTPSMEKVEYSFLNHVQNAADYFISKYADLLEVDAKKAVSDIKTKDDPSIILSDLLTLCRKAGEKIYVIIDEYDNFANTILATAGQGDYEKLTHGDGFFRTFFNSIKTGTTSSDTPISRLFMSGVSPITMDDVTSGFNIGENISTDSAFNDMLGFREQDVVELIEYYREWEEIKHETPFLIDVMNRWYNHYRFSEQAGTEVYNSTLVLYFLKEYSKNHKMPAEFLDHNVRIDYGKLRHLIVIDKKGTRKANGNFSKLKAVIEDGFVSSRIEKGFPLKNLERPENFCSLLFYFGLLTITGEEKGGKLTLAIPNESVKRLFYQYISEAYDETDVFSINLDKYSQLIEDMAFNRAWEPLFEYVGQRMNAGLGLRDLLNAEKAIRGFLNAYLGLSELYIVHSERELNKGYPDLVLEPFLARYEEMKYSYILEIKYLKQSAPNQEDKIQQLQKEAEEQLKTYSLDQRFKKSIYPTTLIKLVLVFSGHKLVHISEVKS